MCSLLLSLQVSTVVSSLVVLTRCTPLRAGFFCAVDPGGQHRDRATRVYGNSNSGKQLSQVFSRPSMINIRCFASCVQETCSNSLGTAVFALRAPRSACRSKKKLAPSKHPNRNSHTSRAINTHNSQHQVIATRTESPRSTITIGVQEETPSRLAFIQIPKSHITTSAADAGSRNMGKEAARIIHQVRTHSSITSAKHAIPHADAGPHARPGVLEENAPCSRNHALCASKKAITTVVLFVGVCSQSAATNAISPKLGTIKRDEAQCVHSTYRFHRVRFVGFCFTLNWSQSSMTSSFTRDSFLCL